MPLLGLEWMSPVESWRTYAGTEEKHEEERVAERNHSMLTKTAPAPPCVVGERRIEAESEGGKVLFVILFPTNQIVIAFLFNWK